MESNILEHLETLISTQGRITFAQFMEIALYHEQFGYYNNADKAVIGIDGDFYTSPDAHPFIGKVLAAEIKRMRDIAGGGHFSIIEMGAGKGVMALDILTYLRENEREFFDAFDYCIIEKSSAFRSKQQALLADFAQKTHWIDSLAGLAQISDGTGCVISNELVDAFPFHRVTQHEGRLKELYVALEGGKLVEQAGELSTDQLSQYFERIGISLADGMKTEVNLDAMQWIKDVSSALKKGFVITIDYGYPAVDYYDHSRTKGTFMCYSKHNVSEQPFEMVGEQDITAHVDFTSLASEGKKWGLELLAFTDLPSFLVYNGRDLLAKEMEKISKADQVKAFKASSAIKNLIHPEGMGGKFKVLIQGKGVDTGEIIKERVNKKNYLSIKPPR